MSDSPFRAVGFAAAEFTYVQPNGVALGAPLEFWVAAILTTLPDLQRAEVLKRVELIKANQAQIRSTDDFPLVVSRA